MKKIAFLIGGEFRTFEYCYPFWKNNFLKYHNYDLFVSTWNKSHSFTDSANDGMNQYQHLNKIVDINEEKIVKVTGVQPKFASIENPINFDHRGNNTIYHWHRLLTALMNFRDDYDLAILTRPDVRLNPCSMYEFVETCDVNNFYGCSEIRLEPPPLPYRATMNFIFFMSSPKKLIDTLLPVPYMKLASSELINQGRGDNMHTHLAKYFLQNDYYVYEIYPGEMLPVIRIPELTP